MGEEIQGLDPGLSKLGTIQGLDPGLLMNVNTNSGRLMFAAGRAYCFRYLLPSVVVLVFHEYSRSGYTFLEGSYCLDYLLPSIVVLVFHEYSGPASWEGQFPRIACFLS
jgi:hypothetical protein